MLCRTLPCYAVLHNRSIGPLVAQWVWRITNSGADGSTGILNNPRARQELSTVQGIILDEAMMAEEGLLAALTEILQEVPLQPSLRRVAAGKAVGRYGFRDIILGGDIRQLPPASGGMPF